MSNPKSPSVTAYSTQDHATWAKYHKRQKALVSKFACTEFLAGAKKLALNPKRVPERVPTGARIRRMTGWKLTDCGRESVSMKDWFEAMRKREFPVTNYIRPPHQFDYTPNPDLLHEYFGHLPFLTDKKFAALAQRFGAYAKHANHRQLVQISRLWSLTVEFGLVKERGKLKLLGAGLLSSYGEAGNAIKAIKKGKTTPFDLKKVTATPGRTFEWHKKYFVMENLTQISEALDAYAKKEKLSVG